MESYVKSRKNLRANVNKHQTNSGKSPKIVFTHTFIFCNPICPNNCGVDFCENIFSFSINNFFSSTAQICKFYRECHSSCVTSCNEYT